ncbi:hypothetical protein KQH82_08475 [bacterium]|nr:hypothetical protein [bacterium]
MRALLLVTTAALAFAICCGGPPKSTVVRSLGLRVTEAPDSVANTDTPLFLIELRNEGAETRAIPILDDVFTIEAMPSPEFVDGGMFLYVGQVDSAYVVDLASGGSVRVQVRFLPNEELSEGDISYRVIYHVTSALTGTLEEYWAVSGKHELAIRAR